jgi:uncharacterized protein (TIGR04255 family)
MLDLPGPPRYRMTAAPLVQALVQVRFPIIARLQTIEGAAAVQHSLGARLPYLTQSVVQQVSMMVGPAGPAGPAAPQAEQSVVHELTSDGGWTLALTVNSATLSIGPDYAGIDDFVTRFGEACEALAAAGVGRCDRLGVRYLDLVEIGPEAVGWETWFRPEFVGVAAPVLSRDNLMSSLTETRLSQEPEGVFAALQTPIEGILRHGVVPAGSLLAGVPPRPVTERAFVFDMDTFVTAQQPFDVAALPEQFRALHTEIEKVFHWAVTDAGKERFGYEEIAEGEA